MRFGAYELKEDVNKLVTIYGKYPYQTNQFDCLVYELLVREIAFYLGLK